MAGVYLPFQKWLSLLILICKTSRRESAGGLKGMAVLYLPRQLSWFEPPTYNRVIVGSNPTRGTTRKGFAHSLGLAAQFNIAAYLAP